MGKAFSFGFSCKEKLNFSPAKMPKSRMSPENPGENPRSKGENQQQTQPTYDAESGNRTWPGFDSRTRRHMWVEFSFGSRPLSEGFSPVFPPPQKPTFLNSNSTWNARSPLNELQELFGASWVNKLHLQKIIKITFTCDINTLLLLSFSEDNYVCR